jgi:NAD(P)H-hydrate repair Nnr-like enzyme with NAD(P)H-hydrate dehydratase domain
LCFFFPENKKYIGEWIIKKIGLSQNVISKCETRYHFITEENLTGIISSRKIFSHKGSYGHALIIAGSAGMPGAAQLCGIACLTTGAGLVTISSDEVAMEHPELMTIPFPLIPEQLKNSKYNVAGIGPVWEQRRK